MGKTRTCLTAATGAAALLWIVVSFFGCGLPDSGQSEAARAFKKEVAETRNALAPALTAALARDPQNVQTLLEKQCALARSDGRSFTCGITVLDRHGITLASATLGDPQRRLNYSRYEVVMKALKEQKVVNTKLFLQDRTVLYIVGVPLVHDGGILGLLVLVFDASDLKSRLRLTEDDFLKMDLNR